MVKMKALLDFVLKVFQLATLAIQLASFVRSALLGIKRVRQAKPPESKTL